ncbi:MAG: BlaI/MecI/CopY family transcriptional regulator [Bacteroidia bacterium]|nr:BlaI/MecI/CopY family transcriptional regulator [Bacteroidia bacterium]
MNSPSLKPTDAELEILQVLWRHGPSTVRFVNDQMSQQREIGYTTTLKLMQIMAEKGLLYRDTRDKTHVYHAQVSQADTQQQLLDRLLDSAFQGSAMNLVMQALGSHKTSPAELEEIRRFLDSLETPDTDTP